MLEIFTVMAFAYLMFSLLATTINEVIASLSSMRGKNMEKAIKAMFDHENDNTFWENFKNNPLYKQLFPKIWTIKKKRTPSYLEPTQFSRIVSSTIKGNNFESNDIRANIHKYFQSDNDNDNELPVKHILLTLYQEGIEEWYAKSNGASNRPPSIEEKNNAFKQKLEEWFEGMMDRAAGWYKRKIQLWLIGIGFLIAFVSDADSFEMYRNLSKDNKSRQALVSTIDDFMDDNDSLEDIAEEDLNLLLTDQLKAARNSLGFRDCSCYYKKENTPERKDLTKAEKDACFLSFDNTKSIWVRLSKFFGWLVTALAISLGAPFWFDLLKRIIHIRNAGEVPNEKKVIQQKGKATSTNVKIVNQQEDIIG